MNVAIFNLRDLIKITIRLFIIIISLIVFCFVISRKVTINDELFKKSLETCLNSEILPKKTMASETNNIDGKRIIAMTLRNFNTDDIDEEIEVPVKKDEEAKEEVKTENNQTVLATISKSANTEVIEDKNIKESYTDIYENVRIKNQSNISLTEEMLIPNVDLSNKKDVLIFHTHTCESYTSSDEFPYDMTGNYRTTDNNFNMVRVGDELEKYLTDKGFSVIHNKTMHDYPSYTGSYDRSLVTVQNLLYEKNTDIVIDLHRDAVGDGTTYGPKVRIDGEEVAQLMFVIGTNGSGLDHPNWNDNLKIAIKIQAKANQMYPRII